MTSKTFNLNIFRLNRVGCPKTFNLNILKAYIVKLMCGEKPENIQFDCIENNASELECIRDTYIFLPAAS